MKTQVLFAGLFLLSVSVIGQEVGTKSESSTKAAAAAQSTGNRAALKNEASSTSAVELKTDAPGKIEARATEAKQKTSESLKAGKKAISDEVKNDAGKVKETVRKDRQASAEIETNAGANTQVKGNKVSKDASLSSHTSISSESSVKAAKEAKIAGGKIARETSSSALETENNVRTKAKNDLASTGDNTRAAIKKTSKKAIEPVDVSANTATRSSARAQGVVKPVKMNSGVKTSVISNSGIRIK